MVKLSFIHYVSKKSPEKIGDVCVEGDITGNPTLLYLPFTNTLQHIFSAFPPLFSPNISPPPPPPKFPSLSHQHEGNCRGGEYTVTSSSTLNLCPRNHRKKAMSEGWDITRITCSSYTGESVRGLDALCGNGLGFADSLYISQLASMAWEGGGSVANAAHCDTYLPQKAKSFYKSSIKTKNSVVPLLIGPFPFFLPIRAYG